MISQMAFYLMKMHEFFQHVYPMSFNALQGIQGRMKKGRTLMFEAVFGRGGFNESI